MFNTKKHLFTGRSLELGSGGQRPYSVKSKEAKVPNEICAPSNCLFVQSNEKCREEKRSLIQNIPSEECDLEPNETCKMETVLVPRLIQRPNCIKVPKEICVNAKTNPRKVSKPVIKEWCYGPADQEAQSSRLALSEFFNNRR